jgi:hypothetical protein
MFGNPRLGQEFAYRLPFRVSVVCEDHDTDVYIDDEGRVPEGGWTQAEAIEEVKEVVRSRFQDLENTWDLTLTFDKVGIYCDFGAAYGIVTIHGGIPLEADGPAEGFMDLMRINSVLKDQSMFGKKQTILNRLG